MTAPLDEQEEIEQVVYRLTQAFPGTPQASVRNVTAAAWSQFAHSKGRDFVPVLAERSAKAHLRTSTN